MQLTRYSLYDFDFYAQLRQILDTFCISVLPNESPIIMDDLQARDASIARTLGGHTESAVSDR